MRWNWILHTVALHTRLKKQMPGQPLYLKIFSYKVSRWVRFVQPEQLWFIISEYAASSHTFSRTLVNKTMLLWLSRQVSLFSRSFELWPPSYAHLFLETNSLLNSSNALAIFSTSAMCSSPRRGQRPPRCPARTSDHLTCTSTSADTVTGQKQTNFGMFSLYDTVTGKTYGCHGTLIRD